MKRSCFRRGWIIGMLAVTFLTNTITAAATAGKGITDADWAVLDSICFPGTNNIVYAVAYAKGCLYVGGDFTAAGDIPAGYVAKWDGSKWSQLGSGTSRSVRALVVDSSGNLFAGGVFDSANGAAAQGVAKWDGNAWTSLGSGLAGAVYALAFDAGGNLYAGGRFDSSGGLKVHNIAKWSGGKWDSLESGIGLRANSYEVPVQALAFDNKGLLYAAGQFAKAGSVLANSIAKWNGSKWDTCGQGIFSTSDIVHALCCDTGGNLFAAGSGTKIMKFNGQTWTTIGTANSSVSGYAFFALATNGRGTLYAGGYCYSVDSVPVHTIGKWDGSHWSALGLGTKPAGYGYSAHVMAIAIGDSGNLFAGGWFDTAGGIGAANVAQWNTTKWSILGKNQMQFGGSVNAVAAQDNGRVFACGGFSQIGGISASNIAKWDYSQWNAFGSGMKGYAYACCMDKSGGFYAGGSFTSVSDVGTGHVAKWYNFSWSGLAYGMNGTVLALAFDNKNGVLYAGGTFDTVDGNLATRVARYDGKTWSRLQAGMYDPKDTVYALACNENGELFAAGHFKTAGSASANNIAKWDGSSWNALGSGTKGYYPNIYALACDGKGNLYAGGSFDSAGGVPARNIARWDGSKWTACGSDASGTVKALVCDRNGNLYAGSDRNFIGADYMGKWDGAQWSHLGSGVKGQITSFAVSDSTLYVGGSFLIAGNLLTPNIAKANIHNIPSVGVIRPNVAGVSAPVLFRLVNSNLMISNVNKNDRVSLYSLSGRCIREAQGVSRIRLSNISPQPLIVRVNREGRIVSSGMVIVQ
jgi:hypothetical protein